MNYEIVNQAQVDYLHDNKIECKIGDVVDVSPMIASIAFKFRKLVFSTDPMFNGKPVPAFILNP